MTLNASNLNKKSKTELDKLKWNDLKGLSKAQRQLLTGGARVRMAQAHKEHMLERAATRQPQYPKSYYDALLQKLESMPIDDTDVRVGEGVTQKQQMRNIILAAKNVDHNFTKVISDISDEYIACARTGIAKANARDPYSAVLKGKPKEKMTIYGHKYDPFSPSFGDDLFFALDTIVTNFTASYNFASENDLEQDWFTSSWWKGCFDGATSNIAGNWLMIEAPRKLQSRDIGDLLKSVAKGKLSAEHLPHHDYPDAYAFVQVVGGAYNLAAPQEQKTIEGLINAYKSAPFTIGGKPLIDENGNVFPDLIEALENVAWDWGNEDNKNKPLKDWGTSKKKEQDVTPVVVEAPSDEPSAVTIKKFKEVYKSISSVAQENWAPEWGPRSADTIFNRTINMLKRFPGMKLEEKHIDWLRKNTDKVLRDEKSQIQNIQEVKEDLNLLRSETTRVLREAEIERNEAKDELKIAREELKAAQSIKHKEEAARSKKEAKLHIEEAKESLDSARVKQKEVIGFEKYLKEEEQKLAKQKTAPEISKVKSTKKLAIDPHVFANLKERREKARDEANIKYSELNQENEVKEKPKQIEDQLLMSKVEELKRLKAIELPSHLTSETFVKYLKGAVHLDELINNPKKRSQLREGVGQRGGKAHAELMQELHKRLGIEDTQHSSITEQAHEKKQKEVSMTEPDRTEEEITSGLLLSKLTAAANEGLIAINKPLKGENGIINFMLDKATLVADRKLEETFRKAVFAEKQAGQAVQDKEAFLKHAKKFTTTKNILDQENKEQKDSATEMKKIVKDEKAEIIEQYETTTLPMPKRTHKENKTVAKIEEEKPYHKKVKALQFKDQKEKQPSVSIYDEMWDDFYNRLVDIEISKDQGFITKNAHKKILDYMNDLKSNKKMHGAERLRHLRDKLIDIQENNLKNNNFKKLVHDFRAEYLKIATASPQRPKKN